MGLRVSDQVGREHLPATYDHGIIGNRAGVHSTAKFLGVGERAPSLETEARALLDVQVAAEHVVVRA
jgi:hypothetical protein